MRNPLTLFRSQRSPTGTTGIYPFSWEQYQNLFTYAGNQYPLFGIQSYTQNPQTQIGSDFAGMISGAYRANGIVFALIAVRMAHFAEARFQFQQLRKGRPGDLFGDPALAILEEPEPGFTTGDMLSRALLDVDLAGNWLAVERDGMIKRMQPDWVDVVIGTNSGPGERYSLDARRIGYVYWPGGRDSGQDPELMLADEVAHFMPYPDPQEPYRGMSWVTPVVREVMADNAARDHKIMFFERGATSNVALNVDPARVTQEEFDQFADAFRAKYEGISNAYKTMMLRGAVDLTVIGTNFEQMDFKVVQGAGETRIAAAAGVPPIVAGFSEGLQAATYSNYDQARRRFADGTLRSLWRNVAGSLQTIVPSPDPNSSSGFGSRLWYDDRDIAFLRIDAQEEAALLSAKAAAIKQLVDSGYEPDSAVDAIDSGDLSRLKHSGLPTVQVQAPPAELPGATMPMNGGKSPAALPPVIP